MAAEGGRRARLLQLAWGAVFLSAVAVAVLIVASSGGGSGGDTSLEGRAEIDRMLAGIPQRGLVLGDPKAPVKLVEFGDLQCPVCRGYAEDVLPPLIESRVRRGEVKIDFRNFTIIGEQSLDAGAAAVAAGEQGRGWSYVELFYRNQGEENSGYADGAFLRAVAEAAGVEDLSRWERDRTSLTSKVERTTEEAHQLGLQGTPSFAVEGPGSDGIDLLGTPSSTGDIEEAIEEAR